MRDYRHTLDDEAVAIVRLFGAVSAAGLVEGLMRHAHSREDCQRAIQRCLDGGLLRFGNGLKLEMRAEEVS